MVKLYDTGAYLLNGDKIIADGNEAAAELKACGVSISKEDAAKNTMAYSILAGHNTSGDNDRLKIRFDALASHDITYVGIVQMCIRDRYKRICRNAAKSFILC